MAVRTRTLLSLLAALLSVLTGTLVAACSSAGSPASAHRQPTSPPPGFSLAALRAGLGPQARTGPVFYLSLGDSLAQGTQPGPHGGDVETAQGYPDQLTTELRSVLPRLQLVKLGCPGETTSTMIHGGICRYPARSQLAQATRFLGRHKGRVALITIDIGANDPNSCILGTRPSAIFGCLSHRVTKIERNLSRILSALRKAAGREVLTVGMTYYVPELGLWRTGTTGRELAVVTDDLAAGADNLLAADYRRHGARVANVFGAFKSADFAGVIGRTRRAGKAQSPGTARFLEPPNVTEICHLTWMCARPPRGPNEHANDAGYHAIAKSFWQAITR